MSTRKGSLPPIWFGPLFLGIGVLLVWLLFLAPLEWEPEPPPLIMGVLPLSFIVVGALVTRAHLIKRKEEMKKALAWELEDQLKELEEQLSLGHITQEEYEQKRKTLLEKSEA